MIYLRIVLIKLQKETYDVKALRKVMTADYNTLANYIVAL